MSDRIRNLVDQMTLDEKVSLLAGEDWWCSVPIPRLGLPPFKVTDGPIGARGVEFEIGPASDCFPCGTALAATWNPDLIERVGQDLAEDTCDKGAHMLLAPTVNIHRSPLAGRNFECYSEDPYLTARMAIAYINGLQSKGVGACIKHFVCNDSEVERKSMSSEVAERPLRELYLRPFEIAIREAKPWAVMSSYNRINGVYASEHPLLTEVLKGEWGFDGLVMSDWTGTYGPHVVEGGLDYEMPGPARWMGKDYVMEALQQGRVSEASIDDKVYRLLLTMQRTGALDQPQPQPEKSVDRAEHRQVARQAATEAIVLLKNERNILPLDTGKLKSIAVIGSPAKWPAERGGGSTRVNPHYISIPLEAIQNKAGDKVGYAIGCAIHKLPQRLDASWLTSPLAAEYFPNKQLQGQPVYSETINKAEVFWLLETAPHVDLNDFSGRFHGAFTVPESGAYEMSLSCVGQGRLFVDGQQIINLWDVDTPTERDNHHAKTVVKLSTGQAHELLVEYASETTYSRQHFRVGCQPCIPTDTMQQAVDLATKSDVAVVFVGLTGEWESEGFDRVDMNLPGDQAQLIERVSAANPNTVVVINAGSPIQMDWLGQAAAVVQAWYLGQETGNAVADILFGDTNPSGRLPTTFPRRLEDNPTYINYPGENGKVYYGEGLFVGYRYYDKKDVDPLFPFGYGLAYTTFAYHNLRLSASELTAGDTLTLQVDVQNTGKRSGKETVQVYVRDVQSRLVRPEKELKAFAQVELQPDETKTVTLTLDQDALSYYDPASGWVAEPGEFEVLVGSSSRDIRLMASFLLKNGR